MLTKVCNKPQLLIDLANDKRSVIYQLQHNHKLDPIFKSDFENSDGFMSRDEEIEFYSKYFQNAVYDASRLQTIDDRSQDYW